MDRVTSLGADVVVDYGKDDFPTVPSDYDVVPDSLGGETLEAMAYVDQGPADGEVVVTLAPDRESGPGHRSR